MNPTPTDSQNQRNPEQDKAEITRNMDKPYNPAENFPQVTFTSEQEITDANTITDPELKDNARNGAVRYIKAAPAGEGKGFYLFVTLSWKEGDLLFITQKKTPRIWASLDRLMIYLEANNAHISNLTIAVKGNKHD